MFLENEGDQSKKYEHMYDGLGIGEWIRACYEYGMRGWVRCECEFNLEVWQQRFLAVVRKQLGQGGIESENERVTKIER